MADYVIGGTRDMPLIPTKVTGRRRVALRLIRRLNMPKGSSCVDPNIGTDLADLIQDTMSVGDVARAKSVIRAELERDDDVRTATVTGDFVLATKTLPLHIVAIGPKVSVVFNAAATSAGVELLDIEVE
jgi:hypothetical protein